LFTKPLAKIDLNLQGEGLECVALKPRKSVEVMASKLEQGYLVVIYYIVVYLLMAAL
jgi:hypothetical protein